jgi:hypothetical protein
MITYKRNMFGSAARSPLYSQNLHHLNYKEINSIVRYLTVYFATPIMDSLPDTLDHASFVFFSN